MSIDPTTPEMGEPAESGEPPAPAPNRLRVNWLLAAAAAATILAVVIVVVLLRIGGETTLEQAKQECAEETDAVRVGDDGQSMVISRVAADENPGADLFELTCILSVVEMPDAAVSQLDSTRALDGRQDASWDDFTASWTYHPNSGLELILQEAR